MEAQINQSTQQQRKTTGATDDLSAVPALTKVRFGETPLVVNREADTKIDVRHVNFYYGEKQALYDVTLPIRERQVTALSACASGWAWSSSAQIRFHNRSLRMSPTVCGSRENRAKK